MSTNVTVEKKRHLLDLIEERPRRPAELLRSFGDRGFGSHDDGDVALADWIEIGCVKLDVSNGEVVVMRVVPEADALQATAADGT